MDMDVVFEGYMDVYAYFDGIICVFMDVTLQNICVFMDRGQGIYAYLWM